MKLVPGARAPVAAYLVDATVTAAGVHKITAGVATTAALYFKTGRSFAPKTFAQSVKKVVHRPRAHPLGAGHRGDHSPVALRR